MFRIVTITCLFLTYNVFSQNEGKQKSLDIPTSIFSNYTFDNLPLNTQKNTNSLRLTGYKFMVINNTLLYNNLQFDVRNFGRNISFDDINDNYRKAALNINDVRNGNHFIWNMWDTTLQKEFQQNKNN